MGKMPKQARRSTARSTANGHIFDRWVASVDCWPVKIEAIGRSKGWSTEMHIKHLCTSIDGLVDRPVNCPVDRPVDQPNAEKTVLKIH